MPGDLRYGLRLTADARGLVGGVRAGREELGRLTRAVDRGTGAARRYTRSASAVVDANRRAGRSFSEAHGRVLRYAAGLVSVASATAAVRGLARSADEYTQISNALRLATDGAAAYVAAQRDVFAVAQDTRAPLGAVASLYQRLSQSAEELGASQADLLGVTRGVGQALAIQGSSATEAAGPLLQLGQALGGGTVRAEEFNSLLEGAPVLLRAAARHIDGVDGSLARLRQRVNEGTLSSREFFAALQAGLPDLER